MTPVYQLKDDPAAVASMQRASVETPDHGLKPTHGLIGSDSWWAQIANGSLPLRSISGSISGFWPGQGGGGPAEFQLKEPSGETSMWLCNLEPREAARHFQVGRQVKVEYVVQQLKVPFEGSTDSEVTVAIYVG